MQHVFLVGAKSLGAYGGYETFINKLTEYHQSNPDIKYHVAVKANGQGASVPDDVEVVNGRYTYHNADCFQISIPEKLGPAQAIYYDCAALKKSIMEDALNRAFAFTEAGADAIMIHSRKKDPAEIFEFVEKFRAKDPTTPIVVVPTSFNAVTEEEFKARGVNVVIYANQLTRTAFPAMQNAAELILKNHRAKECDDICMPFKDIIRLIPDGE